MQRSYEIVQRQLVTNTSVVIIASKIIIVNSVSNEEKYPDLVLTI